MEKKRSISNTIALRFEAARIVINISKERLYDELDTTKHIYKHMLSGNKKIPFEWVKYMEEHYNISQNWIWVGKGDMFLPKETL